MTLENIKKILKNLPEIELSKAIVSIDDKVYSWKECKDIIEEDEDSDLAKKIITKLEELTE